MATYTIEPDRRTLHGSFSTELPPALEVESGDTVCFRTLDASWSIAPPTAAGQRPRKFEPRDKQRDNGHALCGPLLIKGAAPGMSLEVRIEEVRPGTWGWGAAGGWNNWINDRLGVAGEEVPFLWSLDREAMTARNQLGHVIALRPFMGVMGMPSEVGGWRPSWQPRIHGGNIDCKELVAGTSLYLPIAVPGALFSVGDGHGAQGDGEVSTIALECPMERVKLTFKLHESLNLTTPRAETPAGWITFGFHEDLNEAALLALESMVDLIGEQYSLDRTQALGLASLVVDMRITQMVNGIQGVHAVLPHGAITR